MASILIPSLRPDALEECVKSIVSFTANYEILIDSEPGGIYKGINRLFEEAVGEYIVHIPDDCVVMNGWLSAMISFMKTGVDLGAFRIKLEKFEDPPLPHYFGIKFAPFFCIRKNYAREIGGIFDPRFQSFYGDPDLALRVWRHGGKMAMCNQAKVMSLNRKDQVHKDSFARFESEDKKKFYEKWGHLEHQGQVSTASA